VTDIVAFITARLDEDQAAAEAACDRDSGEWFMGRKWNIYRSEDLTPFDANDEHDLVVYGNVKVQSEHIARHDPARVLRETAAKRRIVECYKWVAAGPIEDGIETDVNYGRRTQLRDVLQLLAAPYADHPDYKPAWSVT
jgi:hypothetical protein